MPQPNAIREACNRLTSSGDLVERKLTAAGADRPRQDPAVGIHQACRTVEGRGQRGDDGNGGIRFGRGRDELALCLERVACLGRFLFLQQVRDVPADLRRTWWARNLQQVDLIPAARVDEGGRSLARG